MVHQGDSLFPVSQLAVAQKATIRDIYRSAQTKIVRVCPSVSIAAIMGSTKFGNLPLFGPSCEYIILLEVDLVLNFSPRKEVFERLQGHFANLSHAT